MFTAKTSSVVRILMITFFCNVISLPLIAMESNVLVSGGLSVGDGIAAGRACIVDGLNQINKICQGDIVVTSKTNSSWDKVLTLSAGIITEEGDANSHAAILGKKLGIPVIVGVKEATKKITHGSSISLDCLHKAVYEIKSFVTIIKPGKLSSITPSSYQGVRHSNSLSFDEQERAYSTSIKQIALISHDKKTKQTKSKKEDKYMHGHRDGAITQERLKNDALQIKKYITGPVASDISKAWWTGKRLATCVVTPYAYDSIPFEFFEKRNGEALESAFCCFEGGFEYVQEKKEMFKQKMGDEKTIDNSKIAEFLYHNVVDHLSNVSDELRNDLKQDPTKMDQYVKSEVVSKKEYMYLTLLNFATRYYLEQEFATK